MKYVNIIVKRLLSTGPSEHSAKFSDSRRLTNFLGKKILLMLVHLLGIKSISSQII